MKITDIKTFLMHVGHPDRTKWASDGHETSMAPKGPQAGARNWLFVKVYTDEGITGIGECSGWPRVIETAIHDMKDLLIGEDPTHIERLWQKMHVSIMGHGMLGTVECCLGIFHANVFVDLNKPVGLTTGFIKLVDADDYNLINEREISRRISAGVPGYASRTVARPGLGDNGALMVPEITVPIAITKKATAYFGIHYSGTPAPAPTIRLQLPDSSELTEGTVNNTTNTFIRDISTNTEDKAITEAIIAMGKTLSLTVVAEGVETQEQEAFLRAHACDEMQGYYFSKPLAAADFAMLLGTHAAGAQ